MLVNAHGPITYKRSATKNYLNFALLLLFENLNRFSDDSLTEGEHFFVSNGTTLTKSIFWRTV